MHFARGGFEQQGLCPVITGVALSVERENDRVLASSDTRGDLQPQRQGPAEVVGQPGLQSGMAGYFAAGPGQAGALVQTQG